MWLAILLVLFALTQSVPAQTVFGAVVQTPNGPVNGLFQQQQNGTVTQINTGLATNDFPSLSRDGRFIVISAPDPARPNQTSTDLFLFDRANGSIRTLVDNTTEALQGGAFATVNPRFSALSPNNQLVVVNSSILITTNLQGVSVTPKLSVHRVSDGFEISLAELGQGNAIDFFRAEYVGISWAPNGTVFATPAYVNTTTQRGLAGSAVGIVLFGFNAATAQWQRLAGQLTVPRIFDASIPSVIETHILPAFSPNGQRLAYFEITWPDALLRNPASARLMVVNSDGSNPRALTSFNPGFYPVGLTWSTDGSQLVLAIAQQAQNGGTFSAFGRPETAVVRSVNSVSGGTAMPVSGITSGFLPSLPQTATPVDGDGNGGGGGGQGGSLSGSTVLSFARQAGGGFILRARDLDPNTTYRLESSTTLDGFPTSQNFTGSQIMAGITIPRNERQKYFRFREVVP